MGRLAQMFQQCNEEEVSGPTENSLIHHSGNHFPPLVGVSSLRRAKGEEGALLASCFFALGDVGSVFESGELERRFPR